jgi:hypothetical protein
MNDTFYSTANETLRRTIFILHRHETIIAAIDTAVRTFYGDIRINCNRLKPGNSWCETCDSYAQNIGILTAFGVGIFVVGELVFFDKMWR